MPTIFDLDNGPLPQITSQRTWHYSLGEYFLNLSDGTRTYSFIGKLEKNAELKRIPDIPLPDIYNGAKVKGKAQVHGSDPSSIYFTIQDGHTNPTYTLRHETDDTWRVQSSGGGPAEIKSVM